MRNKKRASFSRSAPTPQEVRPGDSPGKGPPERPPAKGPSGRITFSGVQLGAFSLTAVLAGTAQVLPTPRALLLPERFLPHSGWIVVVLLSVYAAWIAGRLMPGKHTASVRRRIWFLFSAVFFGQLLLGLLGAEKFLMTGRLHLPVPAMIIAGPLYRAERFFMPLLFGSTLLLVGPAWCSYLCYVGAWDCMCASRKRFPAPLPRLFSYLRVGILGTVVAAAVILRLAGASVVLATSLGGAFGLVGFLIMTAVSRRMGTMVHCVLWCPIGLVASTAGRINPFRLHIAASCTACGLCTRVCRYNALGPENLTHRRVGLSCTLCGDCIGACPHRSLRYSLGRLSGRTAQGVFLVLVSSLHALFLGIARL